MVILGGGGSRPFGGSGGASGNGGAGSGGSGSIPYLTEQDFERALRSEVPALVQFTSGRSQVCKQIAPEVEAFAKEVEGKVAVFRVDIDVAQTLARQLRLQSVPTFMLFAEGRLADAQMGPLNRKQLRAMTEPFLPRQAGALKPAELAQLITQGVVVAIDTRDAGAFGRAHLPKAVHMPLEEIEGRVAELFMQPGQPILYCRSGDKSKDLSIKLAEQNVEVGFLEGGLLAWEADNLPIVRGG
ncbi:MAG: thioredoxin domain-containing protein [Polyangiaceae bacterium]